MESFSEYLSRQSYKRKNLFSGIKKSTFYRKVKEPDTLTISELRFLMRVADLDEQKVIEFIREGEK